MNRMQKQVLEFHKAFGIPTSFKPGIPSLETTDRRYRLVREESAELCVALHDSNLAEIADGIADLLYMTLGAAVECGIDVEPIFDEVHRSNMTKVGGHFFRGKLQKPKTYSPPNLLPILEALGGKNES